MTPPPYPIWNIPSDYGPEVVALLREDELRSPELGPGSPVATRRHKIAAAAKTLPPACAAGLWLWFDFLDDAHAICQEDESDRDRNFWHAILHRREPDAVNAKYWWRRVGPHPVLAQLRADAREWGWPFTTAEAFVDECERVRGTGTPAELAAREVQRLEWQLHFDHCFRVGGSG